MEFAPSIDTDLSTNSGRVSAWTSGRAILGTFGGGFRARRCSACSAAIRFSVWNGSTGVGRAPCWACAALQHATASVAAKIWGAAVQIGRRLHLPLAAMTEVIMLT